LRKKKTKIVVGT
jgi:hypothetical protein